MMTMQRRHVSAWLLLVGLATGPLIAADRPNIVLVLADDVGSGDSGPTTVAATRPAGVYSVPIPARPPGHRRATG